jgi:hypothetical protein
MLRNSCNGVSNECIINLYKLAHTLLIIRNFELPLNFEFRRFRRDTQYSVLCIPYTVSPGSVQDT